jgi:hypothetical protein
MKPPERISKLRSLAGVFGRLTLGIVEIGRNGDRNPDQLRRGKRYRRAG